MLVPVSHAVNVGFVQANGTRFELDGQPHYYLGASYFNAMNEGADCATRPVLDATFERLSELGITNVRIWASSEGAGGTGKLTPTLQPSAGTYSQDMFAGLG